MKQTPSINATLLIAVLSLAIILLLPHFVHDKYYLCVLSFVAIYTILVVGLNLLMGYAGQVSLGHAAFYAMGAYTSAILTTQYHLSSWLAMLIGVCLTAGIAYLVGVPCLRLRGHYLAMATLGFGWIVYIVLLHWDITGGTSGIQGMPNLSIGLPLLSNQAGHFHLAWSNLLVFDNDERHFYLTWAFALVILIISANVVSSRVGRALRALHGSELAAATLGINVARYKVQVFVLSAAYASIAGSLYAHTVHSISPSLFGFTFSVSLVVMVVVGGMASVWGALLGAFSMTMLVEWLRTIGQSVPSLREFDVIAHGIILMLVMIFMPSGLFVTIRDGFARLFRRRTPQPLPAPPAKEVALP